LKNAGRAVKTAMIRSRTMEIRLGSASCAVVGKTHIHTHGRHGAKGLLSSLEVMGGGFWVLFCGAVMMLMVLVTRKNDVRSCLVVR
jgi:hypothetical protein